MVIPVIYHITCRIILDVDLYTSSDYMFGQLNILSIPERICLNKSVLMYKAMHDLTPKYITDLFVPVSNVNSYESRSSVKGDLDVPKVKTQLARQSFSFTCIKIWNSLPVNIRRSESIKTFKTAIKAYHLKTLSN